MWTYKGFTLIELLITIGLMSVIMAGVMTQIGPGPRQTSRDATRKADLQKIVSAIEIYRSDNSGYPTSYTTIPNYLPIVPTDPSAGRNYLYLPANCSGGFCKSYRLCAALEKVTTADPNCTGSCGATCSYSVSGP